MMDKELDDSTLQLTLAVGAVKQLQVTSCKIMVAKCIWLEGNRSRHSWKKKLSVK